MKKLIFVCALFVAPVAHQIVQANSAGVSEIDAAYSNLRENINQAFSGSSSSTSGGQARSQIAEAYAHYIHEYQHSSSVKKVSNEDLDLLRRAAIEAYADTNENDILDDYLLDMSELARRGITSEKAYRDEVYAFVQARMFDKAQEVVAKHPEASISSIPKVSLAKGFNRNEPAILTWDKDSSGFVAKNINLKDYDMVIIGHPLCHFTQRAVADISKNRELKAITKGALWILPQDGRLEPAVISQWNANHPGQSMVIAYLESKWRNFNYWGTPTFYFLKNGAVTRSVIGWPSNGNAEALTRDPTGR